jgi:hypothetical protein
MMAFLKRFLIVSIVLIGITIAILLPIIVVFAVAEIVGDWFIGVALFMIVVLFVMAVSDLGRECS